ncbi:amino acid permease, partial [Enterococcus faecalis]
NIGFWLGVYIPVLVIFLLGLLSMIKVGVTPGGYLGAFSWSKVLRNLENMDTFKYLAGIPFIFVGIEMSSVYIPRLTEGRK